MNSTVAIAEIASRTVLYLAGIGAFCYLAPTWMPRLQVTNPRGRAQQPAAGAGQSVGELDGQKAGTP